MGLGAGPARQPGRPGRDPARTAAPPPHPEPPETARVERVAAFAGPSLTASEAARQLDGAYDDVDDRIDRLNESVDQALGAAADFGGYLQGLLGHPDNAYGAVE